MRGLGILLLFKSNKKTVDKCTVYIVKKFGNDLNNKTLEERQPLYYSVLEKTIFYCLHTS